jgi:hypothetical protein
MAWTLAFARASLLILLAWGVGRSFAADRVRRAEIEAREVYLYQRLANGEAVPESQRQIYSDRSIWSASGGSRLGFVRRTRRSTLCAPGP